MIKLWKNWGFSIIVSGLIAIAITFVTLLSIGLIEREDKREAAFMKECLDYGKPHFECQVMYGLTQRR